MRDRLYRSRDDRMLFGVAGGMGRYFGVDPVLVRLVWVLLFLAAGAGILLYIIAAIIIPEEPAGAASASASGGAAAGAGGTPPAGGGPASPWRWNAPAGRSRSDGGGAIFLGLILVVVGAWFLLQRLVPGLDGRLVWPGLLILLGLLLVVGAMRRGRGAG